MSFFNNMGNNIDITNVKATKYIEGTPKMDKWKKNQVDPIVDAATEEMDDYRKKIYKKELWRVISEGLSEDMFDDECYLDSNVLKLVNMRARAFREGWAAATDN